MLNNVKLVKNLIKCKIQLGLTVSFCKNEIEMENHLFNYYKLRALYHRLQCNKQPLASLCNAQQSFIYCTYVNSPGVIASLYESGCDT